MIPNHIPVLFNELITGLNIQANGVYADCTGGGGGHAAGVLEHLNENGRLIVLDRDLDAVKRLEERFKDDSRVQVFHSKFSEIKSILEDLQIDKLDGLYADFGFSNFHILDAERGFSFRNTGFLDMRMDNTSNSNEISAFEVVNTFSEQNLKEIIYKYGEESFTPVIVRNILKARAIKSISTTTNLANIIKDSIPKKFQKKGINPATKTFQALRIYVNKELEEIELLLQIVPSIVKKQGIIIFISFHSLEDRIVKEKLKFHASDCICPPLLPKCSCNKEAVVGIITKRPIIASQEEIKNNPLSRSAKMRIAQIIV